MSPPESSTGCIQTELVTALALGALPAPEVPAIKAHLTVCVACRGEYDSLQAVIEVLPAWPADTLKPDSSLWDRLASRIESRATPAGVASSSGLLGDEPEWKEAAPGLSCKILSVDSAQDCISMLVRLAPGTNYPPHTHSGVEELHLLDGELWINDRKLRAGDYNRAEPGTTDLRVWSETGCTCILITSLQDRLR
jgi:anti-sigma factor ChrR (cupin superfamily)